MRKLVAVGLFGVLGVASVLALRAFTQSPSSSGPVPVASVDHRQVRRLGPFEFVEVIYDGALGKGWEDWGWGPHDLRQRGPAKVVFAGYGGIVFHHRVLAPRVDGLAFRFKAPAAWGNFLVVALKPATASNEELPRVTLEGRHVVALPDGWREVWIGWSELNPLNLPIDRVEIGASSMVESDWVLLDKVGLTKPPSSAAPPAPPVREVDLTILCSEPSKPISRLIYGISHGYWTTGGTANRMGGNPLTRFNWELGTWNVGKDWYFENVKGGSLTEWLDDAARMKVETALTVPLIGWVAKDTSSVGFPVSKLGKQRKHDPHRADAGDGHAPDGSPLAPGPPTETSVAAPPSVIARWIKTLREQDKARGVRRVHHYILDNEPSLWNDTHRDVFPDPLTYDELLRRTIAYASAIRRTDPEASIAGPAEWGWIGYLYSAEDREHGVQQRPDRLAHGDVPLVAWYLQQLALHEKTTGERLLDFLDLHFYPAAQGIFGQAGRTDPEGAALRIRSTRALWDPDYVDESWISDRIRLIPRMKEWVAKNYPGRRTSLGEWSFGGDEHISGALATAEALGRFGEQGLDAAFYWPGPKPGTRTFWGFRAYTNFDDKGGRFLDLSIPTKTAQGVSIFASRDESGKHIVAVVLNLDPVFTVRARIDTASCGKLVSQRSFSYSESVASLTEDRAPRVGLAGEALPPYSLRVLDATFEK